MNTKRRADQLRPVSIQRRYTSPPYGSVLISTGNTRVLCTASLVRNVPQWLAGKGEGWITAEYGMLPGSVSDRQPRKLADGRSQEIQRLIGRSLRAVVDRAKLGVNTLWLDCDVLEADGGTRTAAVTGSYVALYDALTRMREERLIAEWPLKAAVAAVSVGMVEGRPVLDLDYALDVRAEVDMNIVMTSEGKLVEVQGAAERGVFSEGDLSRMLKLARRGLGRLFAIQDAAICGTA
jgi:ribonuclease PH